MIEVGSFLALSSAVNTPDNFCHNMSLVWHGQERDVLLRELAKRDQATWATIERLSDNILYAPNLQGVEDRSQGVTPRLITNRQELRVSLEPVQRSFGDLILSSTMIMTPDKMLQAMVRNPWDALMGVRPAIFFNAKIPHDGVLVQFEYSGVCYLGWHMRIALQRLFDCILHIPTEQSNAEPITEPIAESAKIAASPLIGAWGVPTSNSLTLPAALKREVIPSNNRYIIHPDGTVTDSKTKLMWQRCSVGQRWTGTTCEGEPSTMTLDQASSAQVRQTMIETMLNKKPQAWPTFAGYNDWRLPTIEELRSLVWCSNGTSQEEAWKYGCAGMGNRNGDYQKPTLDSVVFPNTPPWQFWSISASAYSSSLSRAWVVYFGGGCVNDFAGSYNYSVRLVRNA